ncbi:unnamed protein product [Angiostrongylus costaricensis]|uniref:Protein kinase C n=1 Tax=Angiostrongylus costaricensis TaxID=334426 RepID=A0A0R3PDB6_ANGCS|nr:unnamed protein product [Angiostrongylus costaricensis]
MQMDSNGDPRIHVTLQYGNNKEIVTLERIDEPQSNGCIVEVIVVDRNEKPTRPHVLECFAGVSLELPHSLAENNYLTPTKCKICDKMLKGLIRQGLKCRDCGVGKSSLLDVNVHNKCAHQLPSNCTLSDHAISRMSITDASQANLVSMDDEPSSSENIPLFRLPGQAISKIQAHPKVEGWMIHFLLSDPERRLKHYWVLANDAINMYNEYNEGVNPKKRYVTLPLAEILAITPHHGPPVHSKLDSSSNILCL